MRRAGHFPLPVSVRIGNARVRLADDVARVEILEPLHVDIRADQSAAAVQQDGVERLRRERMRRMEIVVEPARGLRMAGGDEALYLQSAHHVTIRLAAN